MPQPQPRSRRPSSAITPTAMRSTCALFISPTAAALELTDVTVDKPLREPHCARAPATASPPCSDPATDSHHDGHIHVDLIPGATTVIASASGTCASPRRPKSLLACLCRHRGRQCRALPQIMTGSYNCRCATWGQNTNGAARGAVFKSYRNKLQRKGVAVDATRGLVGESP